jgi:hypothetical protein
MIAKGRVGDVVTLQQIDAILHGMSSSMKLVVTHDITRKKKEKLKEINKQSNGEESTPPSDEQDSSKTQTQEETRSSQLHRVEAEATPQPEVQLRRSNRVPKPNPKYANAALADLVNQQHYQKHHNITSGWKP